MQVKFSTLEANIIKFLYQIYNIKLLKSGNQKFPPNASNIANFLSTFFYYNHILQSELSLFSETFKMSRHSMAGIEIKI